MSRNNSQEKDDKPSKKNTKESPSKKGKSKQGKMNPTKPFEKISKYESEDEGSDNDSDVSREEAQNATSEPTNDQWSTADNRFKSVLRNKSILAGQDFCQIMAKNQGAGSKNLKGSELKRHLTWKESKMIISKLALAGASLKCMEVFLTSVKVHLTSCADYNDVAADIVARICNILQKNCFMENVDNSVFAFYFNKRVADLRNRRNYVNKYVNNVLSMYYQCIINVFSMYFHCFNLCNENSMYYQCIINVFSLFLFV